jgi:hypothetical protein
LENSFVVMMEELNNINQPLLEISDMNSLCKQIEEYVKAVLGL